MNLDPLQVTLQDTGILRKFDTGATRDTAQNKLDYEGFFSPEVLHRFAIYMNVHRKQSDGTLRSSDNWQKGMPKEDYAKSLIRHAFQFWLIHRGADTYDDKGKLLTLDDALCGILFNAMGYMFELIRGR